MRVYGETLDPYRGFSFDVDPGNLYVVRPKEPGQLEYLVLQNTMGDPPREVVGLLLIEGMERGRHYLDQYRFEGDLVQVSPLEAKRIAQRDGATCFLMPRYETPYLHLLVRFGYLVKKKRTTSS